MKVSYDSEHDVVYIKFTDGEEQVITKQVNDDVALDFDREGRVVGLEILSASKHVDLGSLLPVTAERT